MKFLTTANIYGTRKALFLNGGLTPSSPNKFSQSNEPPKVNPEINAPVQDKDMPAQEHTPVDEDAPQGKAPLAS